MRADRRERGSQIVIIYIFLLDIELGRKERVWALKGVKGGQVENSIYFGE